MLSKYKDILLMLFLSSLMVFLIGLYYFFTNPYNFPGLWIRALWFVIPLGFLTLFAYLPFNKIKKISKISNRSYKHKSNEAFILSWIFQFFLIFYLFLLIFNEFISLSLVEYSLNYILALTIIFGIFTILFPYKNKEKEQFRKKDKVFIIILGIIGAILIFIKTKQIGWISYFISLISGILIVLIGYLIYEDEDKKEIRKIKKNKIKKNLNHYNYKKIVITTLNILLGLSLALYFFIGLNAFRIVFGSVYILFLPGFVLSLIFFKKNEIDLLERIALSFALSISIVPLIVFYLNLVGMKINAVNVSLVVLVILIIGGLIYVFKNNKRRN